MNRFLRHLGDTKISAYFTGSLLLFIASFLVLPTSKMVNNVYYIFFALPGLVAFLYFRQRVGRLSLLALLWAVFFGWLLFLGISSGDVKSLKHLLYVALFIYGIIFLIDVRLLTTQRFAAALFWVLSAYIFASAIFYWITGVYAVGQQVLWLPGRMEGPIYTSIWLSCCFGLIGYYWAKENRWILFSVALALTIFLEGFVLQSRSGLVGLIFFLTLLAGCFALQGGRRLGYATLAALTALAALFWAYKHVAWVQSLFNRRDSGRFEVYAGAMQEWRGCGLWTGCGIDHPFEFDTPVGVFLHSHNIYLDLGVYAGLIGLGLFSLILFVTFLSAYKAKSAWGVYLAIGAVGLLFDGSFIINNPNETYLIVLLPAAILAHGRRGGFAKAN